MISTNKKIEKIKDFLKNNKGEKYSKSSLANMLIGKVGKTAIKNNWGLIKDLKGIKSQTSKNRFNKEFEVVWYE